MALHNVPSLLPRTQKPKRKQGEEVKVGGGGVQAAHTSRLCLSSGLMYVRGRSPPLRATALKERLCSRSLLINLQLVGGAERMCRTSQTSSTVEEMQICFLCPDLSRVMTRQRQEGK
ncbi:hypothetical protein Q5P01_005804 [Channa striata]|uniref:Uncharacterized protein n=1 Tax=Channa striata TaxID=64152 RepID=A0AA88NDD0_CHASR|nr:hypothetical protein Q5P01_005804 [Channa striata]